MSEKELIKFLKKPLKGKVCKALTQEDNKILLNYITRLQQENKQLKEEKKQAIECIHLFGIYKDTPDKGLDIRKILKNILEILGDKENE